tara:strand:+ start:281 stop:1150 length:870 start_codon:yes stop_codon:yes gene_type:complete
MKWLIYGHKGWIGSQVCALLECESVNVLFKSELRLDNTVAVSIELSTVKPDRVLCLTGRTHGLGFSTIDYLEQPGKLAENVRDNLYSPISLALLCKDQHLHLTYLGTGCIFTQGPESIQESDGYTEESLPDFTGSGYSTVKGFTDRLMHLCDLNTLNVRIRMPIVGYDHSRNFITKIKNYEKVINVQNSMSVLPELLPIMLDLAKNKKTGTINLTNPGTISHNEILSLYAKYVDKSFTWDNFTLEEQDKILASQRSNNKLNTDVLETLYPSIKNIKSSIEGLFKKWENV